MYVHRRPFLIRFRETRREYICYIVHIFNQTNGARNSRKRLVGTRDGTIKIRSDGRATGKVFE